MKQPPLVETNPYLKNPKERARRLKRSAASSCEVEGIHINFSKMPHYSIPPRKKPITK